MTAATHSRRSFLFTTKFTEMKKTAILVCGLLSGALIFGQLHAQDSMAGTNLAANEPVRSIAPATATPGASPLHGAALSKTITRAIKDFKSRFAKVADEQWSHTSQGSSVYFTSNGFKTRAYYDTRGNWQGSLKYCNESQLPHFIRDVIRRTYYDLAITLVIIGEVPNHVAYIVDLEDPKTLKVVRVSDDGEMDVLQDLTKL